jgi:hypothetical protein
LQGDTVTLAENVGPIPVRFEPGTDGIRGIFGEMTQRDPEFGAELDAKAVARARWAWRRTTWIRRCRRRWFRREQPLRCVLRSEEALARLKVNQEEATAWLRERGARWFYVVAPDQNQDQREKNGTKYRARMQFYGGEDPATGSAAGCAIATSWLAARFLRARVCTCARAWRWAGRAIFFSPPKENREGDAMCALRAAQFLLQKDSFSCRDAHAFNRNSSSQVTLCVGSSVFHLFQSDFHCRLRLFFPLFTLSGTRTVSIRSRQFFWRVSTGVSRRAKTLST